MIHSGLFAEVLDSGTKEWYDDVSSSAIIFPIVFSEPNYEKDQTDYEGIEDSTDTINNNSLTKIDKLIVRRNASEEEIEKNKVVAELVQKLEKALEMFDAEDEDYSSSERIVIQIEHNYQMRILGEVIQDIYVHHFDNPLYLLGICNALLRYDLDEVRPWGAAMLAGLINHPDERVKEYAVQLIDNWCDVELLPILKTLQVSSGWLSDYIKDVVKNLEKENVLYQKVV